VWCGGIFSNHFITSFLQNVPVKKILQIGQYLAKIWTKVCGLLFGATLYTYRRIHFTGGNVVLYCSFCDNCNYPWESHDAAGTWLCSLHLLVIAIGRIFPVNRWLVQNTQPCNLTDINKTKQNYDQQQHKWPREPNKKNYQQTEANETTCNHWLHACGSVWA